MILKTLHAIGPLHGSASPAGGAMSEALHFERRHGVHLALALTRGGMDWAAWGASENNRKRSSIDYEDA